MLTAVKEEQTKAAIAARTTSERRRLACRRVSGLVMNVLLIWACWFVIIYATVVLVPEYALVEGNT